MADADLLSSIRAIVREEIERAEARRKPGARGRRTRSLAAAARLSATVVPASEIDMARARAMRRRIG